MSNSCVGVGGPSTIIELFPSDFSPAAENCDEMPIPTMQRNWLDLPKKNVFHFKGQAYLPGNNVHLPDCTYWPLLLLFAWFECIECECDKLCCRLYSGECNACSLKLFIELLLFAIWLLPSLMLPPVPLPPATSIRWPSALSSWWLFFFDDVTGSDGDDDDDDNEVGCWPVWLLLLLLVLRLLLLIPLCVSIVEGDDVGKFELCIELLSIFLYARDAVVVE